MKKKKKVYKVGDVIKTHGRADMYNSMRFYAEKGIDTKPDFITNNLTVVDICKTQKGGK